MKRKVVDKVKGAIIRLVLSIIGFLGGIAGLTLTIISVLSH